MPRKKTVPDEQARKEGKPMAAMEKDFSKLSLKDKEGKTFTVDTDSVILSVGYNPAPLASKGRHIHVIGDAAEVGNLRTVIWGAWNVAMKL